MMMEVLASIKMENLLTGCIIEVIHEVIWQICVCTCESSISCYLL